MLKQDTENQVFSVSDTTPRLLRKKEVVLEGDELDDETEKKSLPRGKEEEKKAIGK